MRLIGGKDYYDSALSYGHDPSLVLVRADRVLAPEDATRHGLTPAYLAGKLARVEDSIPRMNPTKVHRVGAVHTASLRIGSAEFELSFPTVIVAGTRYQGVRAQFRRGWATDPSVTYCWTEGQFKQWLGQHGLQYGPSEQVASAAYFAPSKVTGAALAAILGSRMTLLVHDPNGTWQLPRWGRQEHWHVDQAILNRLDFARAVPPHLLFQEIEMWLGGVLAGPAKPTVQISDADRAAKHGMDHTSFRRPPSKKRR